MRNQSDELTLDSIESGLNENDFFHVNLKGKTFRGFWYDYNEESYGIILAFKKDTESKLSLFAQDSCGGSSRMEYKIESDSFSLEQIGHDKVLIGIRLYKTECTAGSESKLRLPEYIEFTLYSLSQNSMYIQFLNHKLFSPPINKLRFGLVLANA